jgi:hypothetical protein
MLRVIALRELESLIGWACGARTLPPARPPTLGCRPLRMRAHITRIPTGHLPIAAEPGAVTHVILDAAESVG